MMHRMFRLAVIGAFLLWGASMAQAASPQSYGVQAPALPQSPAPPPTTTGPFLQLFGIPVSINAPTTAPYCNCATQSYSGQTLKSSQALIALPPNRPH
ncbi:MAG TPA: hypothetical protein VMA37_18105 [Acetobacteraceae bacterium]|nr:hypothetical protein [Acetobacteraceae bacterium]